MTNTKTTRRPVHTDRAEDIAMHQQTTVYAVLRDLVLLDGSRVTSEQANDMAFAVYQMARNIATSRGV